MRILFPVVFILVMQLSYAQQDWHDLYPKSALSDVISYVKSNMPNDSVDCKTCYNFYGTFDVKYKVEMKYLDSMRVADDTHKKYLDLWTKTYMGLDSNDLFIRELKFGNGKEQYWVAVQEPTYPYYPDELREGDKVYLYVLFLGTLIVDNKEYLMFVANDFEKK